ncbi:cytochrome P450 2G1-like [Pseudophryne corroboree]|uniref:cytochrome P450 2G1-like n=1 Tax=Pseudophryne corroboree TaxID=495146 RepID=UPI003081DC71
MLLPTAVIILVLLALVCTAWLKKATKVQSLLPPGPSPLPLIGNIHHITPGKFLVSLQKFQEKYGPVFTIYIGSKPTVVLCGYDLLKETLIDQKDAFSGRGKPFDPTFLFSCAVSNIICSIVFGKHYEYKDERFLTLLRNINGTLRFMNSSWGLIFYYFHGLLINVPGPHQQGVHCLTDLKSFVKERVKSSLKTLDVLSPRHFIDCFLIKMQQDKENPDTEFHMENLVSSTLNLFTAGTETVSTTLRYGCLVLLKYQDIQGKIQKEIDQVIGDKCPSAEDRFKMPYTEAVIHEIQRFSDIVPTGLPHRTTEETSVRGYVIPKDMDVLPLLTTVLKDPKYFPQPEMFSPERFLDDQGALKKGLAVLPFSAGRRQCPGEGLARMELFLFLTILLQKFTLTTPVSPEDLDLTPETSSAGHFPRYYKMSAIPRH